MMSCNSEQPRAQAGAKTNGHAHAQGAGSVSSTGADGGEASSADGNDGGEGEPPLSADPPGVEGVGAGAAQPYSLAWWRAQNFPPDDPVLGNILTTTSRAMLVGPTGSGKTSLGMAMSWSCRPSALVGQNELIA